MREGKPSATAAFVAFARGVAPGRRDRHAAQLLPSPLGLLVRLAADRPLLRNALRGVTLGLVDHLARRTAAIDAVVDAQAPETPQLVILGAGLDARAWRFARQGLSIFEVDHPATQSVKRARAPLEDPPTYVPVRFGQESLAEALAAAGHRSDRPTVWIWEGVTMYLPREAVEETLAQVQQRSAPKSVLAVTYLGASGPIAAPAVGPAVRWAFQTLGERLYPPLEPGELEALLGAHGFVVRGDGGSADWPGEWGGDPRLAGLLLGAERLCVAEYANGHGV